VPERERQLYLPAAEDDRNDPAVPTPREWGLLVLSSARSRWVLAIAVLLLGIGATVAVFRTKSPLYRVEAKILAQRQQALPSAVRSIYEDVPTRSAWELIHGRENLVALVREGKLLEGGKVEQSDSKGSFLLDLLGKTSPPSDPVERWVGILDKRLIVTTLDGTIAIELDWPDPQQAYDIVHATLQNFLDARYLQEVKSIDEVIAVLEGQAAKLRQELDAASDEAHKKATRVPRAIPSRAREPTEELVRLESLLHAKQRALQDLEEFRRRRLADLQSQLDQALNTLSEAHPTVVRLRKDISAASRESPQIEALRGEERRIRKEYTDRLQREGLPSTGAAAVPPPPPPATDGDRDPGVLQARAQYDQMLARVNAAKVELDAARAAFKYRYSVVWPPQLPRDPVSPDPKKIFGLGVMASLLLALLAAAAPDLWSRRIVRRWQVERTLELPVFGEIHRRP
jgi:hypothetical protein